MIQHTKMKNITDCIIFIKLSEFNQYKFFQ